MEESGTEKVLGGEVFQFGWPAHERSRTFTILGGITHLHDGPASPEGSEQPSSRAMSSLDASAFISPRLIGKLTQVHPPEFDLTRLIKYCEEINDNFARGNLLSVAFLSRGLLDHCPPIFGQTSFEAVAAQAKGNSFKAIATRLDGSLKKIAEHHMHKQIGENEALLTPEEISFSSDLSFLIGRIIERLPGPAPTPGAAAQPDEADPAG